MNSEKTDEFNNLFGEEKNVLRGSDNPLNFHSGDTNVTPNILLEQLAYVDNFMPDFESDMASLGGPAHDADVPNLGLGLDERLAAELSAFADETFIFPDEDKPVDRGDNDGENYNDDSADQFDQPLHDQDRIPGASSSASASASSHNLQSLTNASESHPGVDASDLLTFQNRSSRFLSQRRNNFLASQHDTRLRFSSKNHQRDTTRSPSDDHGSFTNVDITEGSSQPIGQPNFTYVNSPLNNLVTDSNPQTIEMLSNGSNTPYSSQLHRQSSQLQPEPRRDAPLSQVPSHIHMPDYSSIPTRTLLTLLPKARVPTGARNALSAAGLQAEEIDSIAAIMAYHQLHNKPDSSGDLSLSNVRELLSSETGANFLLPFLTNDNKPARQNEPSQAVNTRLEKSQSSLNQNNREIAADHLFRSFFNADGEKPHTDTLGGEVNRRPFSSHTQRPSSGSLPTEKEPMTLGQERRNSRQLSSDRSDSGSGLIDKRAKSHPKRKLKEQEMEGSIQELSELALSLQQRIQTLEMENRLLKNLVTERGELKGVEEVENVRRELLRKIKEDSNKPPGKEDTKFG
ncbi:LAME_0H12860g1_1 [Lachancea meyersii CBS 8951]|uniref:LAME_0H12860g1_1 n=1 Tax=Lachancea meyersii CBS 8951 TaxID=1266667 RepID=A0A1G4KGR0_9SACH|nr:LAME_0H12860g1_1 [Lachancea meyersii CBS 8951]